MDILPRLWGLRWLPIRHWYDLRHIMRLRVTVRDPVDGKRYRFVADSLPAYQRARAVLSKEPDTIDWLRTNLRPDDVFLDIGANVGTFSIFAAKHISDQGHVYACEPHLPTAVQLLQNVAANGLQNRISVISAAASGDDGFHPFHYKRWRPGASGSQLDVPGGPGLQRPLGTELKVGMRVDTMIGKGLIRAPHLIKIDTDGIELPITRGMQDLLTRRTPRSVLVEIQAGELNAQRDFMAQCGYALAASHVVGKWKRLHDRGEPPEDVAFNAVFAPAT
jgi:FkbM family methyltransferase